MYYFTTQRDVESDPAPNIHGLMSNDLNHRVGSRSSLYRSIDIDLVARIKIQFRLDLTGNFFKHG